MKPPNWQGAWEIESREVIVMVTVMGSLLCGLYVVVCVRLVVWWFYLSLDGDHLL